MPLTDIALRKLKRKDQPYKLTDAEGLYLLVKPVGGLCWRMDYHFCSKRRALALGVPANPLIFANCGTPWGAPVFFVRLDTRGHRG